MLKKINKKPGVLMLTLLAVIFLVLNKQLHQLQVVDARYCSILVGEIALLIAIFVGVIYEFRFWQAQGRLETQIALLSICLSKLNIIGICYDVKEVKDKLILFLELCNKEVDDLNQLKNKAEVAERYFYELFNMLDNYQKAFKPKDPNLVPIEIRLF